MDMSRPNQKDLNQYMGIRSLFVRDTWKSIERFASFGHHIYYYTHKWTFYYHTHKRTFYLVTPISRPPRNKCCKPLNICPSQSILSITSKGNKTDKITESVPLEPWPKSTTASQVPSWAMLPMNWYLNSFSVLL